MKEKEKEDKLKKELLPSPNWHDLEPMTRSEFQNELDQQDTYETPDDILTVKQKYKLRGLKIFYFWALISLLLGVILGIYFFYLYSNENYLKIPYMVILATIVPMVGSIIILQLSIKDLNQTKTTNPIITRKQKEARIGLKSIRKWYVFIIVIIIVGVIMDLLVSYMDFVFYRVLLMIAFFGSAVLSLVFKDEVFIGEFM